MTAEGMPRGEPPAAGSEPPIAYDNGNHSLGLAAMRGIAAVGVLIYHSLLVLPLAGEDTSNSRRINVFDDGLLREHLLLGLFNGRGLVVLFFVLSGCVLALSLDRKGRFGAANLPGYWLRRGFRLYPLLIVAATFGALLQWWAGQDPLPYASDWANWHYSVPRDEIVAAWAKNAAGISSSLNSPAWSIRVELLASFVFPLLFIMTLKPALAMVGITACLLLMFGLPLQPHHRIYVHIFLFSFLLGALVPRYGGRLADAFGGLGPLARYSYLLALALVFMFARRLIDPEQFAPKPVIIIESLVATVFVSLALYRSVPGFMTGRLVQALGRISYGIYLFHLIVLFALVNLLLPALPPAIGERALLVSSLLALATLVVTLPLAWLLYGLIEAPLQRIGNRLGASIDRRMTSRVVRSGSVPQASEGTHLARDAGVG